MVSKTSCYQCEEFNLIDNRIQQHKYQTNLETMEI